MFFFPWYRIGVVAFATNISHILPLTNNHENIKKAINNLSVGIVGNGNTSEPFTLLHPILNESKGIRYILVLTDGTWSGLTEKRATSKAKKCFEDKIEIIALGFGGVKKEFLDLIASSKEYSKLTTLNNLSDAFTGFAKDIGMRKILGVSNLRK